eukprot:3831488-Amphidinium_carterae.1
MSPKRKGVPIFSISSNPTTPRDSREDQEEDDWGSICCLCGDIMQLGDRISCCGCTHHCHSSCHYICEGEAVCGHCKADHFRKDQEFDPPMSNAMLLTNIENGVVVEGSDKILRREHQRLKVLEELAGSKPVDSAQTMGSAAMSVLSSGDDTTKGRESRPLRDGAAGGILSPAAPMESTSAVVQRFEVHGRCDFNQEQMQEIWKLVQEVANHLHSVARFAGQGLELQWRRQEVLQQVLDLVGTEVNQCMSMAYTTAQATEKQDEIMSKFRTCLDKTQGQLDRVSGLLEGITTPVKEIFAQNYDGKLRMDELAARLIQLEDNGVKASEKDMCANLEDRVNGVIHAIWSQQDLTGPHSPFREGPTLMDRVSQILEDKISSQQSLVSTVDARVQGLNKELEKCGTQSEIQAKAGTEEHRIRKQVESYLTTVTKEGEKVRIDMFSSSLNNVETAQRNLEAMMLKLQESEDRRVLAMSEDQQRIKRPEATVQELLAKQVKEQKIQKPNHLDPLHSTAPARGRSRPGSNRGARQHFLSRSQNSVDSDCAIGSPIPHAASARVPSGTSAGTPIDQTSQREKLVNQSERVACLV